MQWPQLYNSADSLSHFLKNTCPCVDIDLSCAWPGCAGKLTGFIIAKVIHKIQCFCIIRMLHFFDYLQMIPAEDASCPHRPLHLLRQQGRGERQRKEAEEADWTRQLCWDWAELWILLLEPHLPRGKKRGRQLFLRLIYKMVDRMIGPNILKIKVMYD